MEPTEDHITCPRCNAAELELYELEGVLATRFYQCSSCQHKFYDTEKVVENYHRRVLYNQLMAEKAITQRNKARRWIFKPNRKTGGTTNT